MIKTKQYENGLKLVVDEMTGFESVAFNVFVKTGSVNEQVGEYGISHFIEHMLFKGTKTRSSYEISKEFDTIGAVVNAYTSLEETDFYTKSASEDTEKCVEVLSDMLFYSTFDTNEMEREKQVVIEEIKMYDDDPQSKAELIVNSNFYSGTPYARDVAGSISSVKTLSQNKMFEYKNKFYIPQNITLSFAGKINFKTAEQLVEKYFIPYFKNEEFSVNIEKTYKPKQKITFSKSFKNNEQSQVCISFPGLYRGDDTIYSAKIFDIIFGHGMSCILFQSIREKLGLVYTISSSLTQNHAGGDLTISFATSNKNVGKALTEIKKQIEIVKKNGISKDQFESAKSNYINSIKLSFENTSYVSLFNAKRYSLFDEILTKEQYIKNVERVCYEDVLSYIKTRFSKKHYSIAIVGKNKNLDIKKYFN